MKQFTLRLALLGVTLLLTLSVFARDFEYTYEGQTITYTVIDENAKTCRTTKCVGASGDLIIPELANDGKNSYTVIIIGNETFKWSSRLTHVKIPDTVTVIGYYAFSSCTELKSIDIPSSVTNIGLNAFEYSGLESITIPNSVVEIKDFAFYKCKKLTKVNFTSIESMCQIKYGNETSNPRSVCEYTSLYINNKPVTNIIIPSTVEKINKYAFLRVKESSLVIPPSVKSIEKDAFSQSSFTKVLCPNSIYYPSSYFPSSFICTYSSDIPDLSVSNEGIVYDASNNILLLMPVDYRKEYRIPVTTTQIANGALAYCRDLPNIVIPNSVTSIGDYAFYCCSALTNITIPNSVTSIGQSAFGNTVNLKSIDFQASVTSIEPYTFMNSGLTSVQIPDAVNIIGAGAFSQCSLLEQVSIPKSVTKIDKDAFKECLRLITVNFGSIESMCNIEYENAYDNPLAVCVNSFFYINDEEVRDIVIPRSVEYINKYTFYGLSLGSLVVPPTVKSIHEDAFKNCHFIKIICPEHLNKPESSMICSYSSNGSSSGSYNISEEGVVYENKSNTILFVPVNCPEDFTIPESTVHIGYGALAHCNNFFDLVIPNKVLTIGDQSFAYCKALAKITIPESVTSIGNGAFAESRLTTVEIPSSVTTIGKETFNNCSHLKSVIIPKGLSTIGDYVFANCTRLSNVEIPNSVTTIENYTFANCSNLDAVKIPDCVTSIGEGAFSGCKSLNDVELPNSLLSIGRSAFMGSGIRSVKIPDNFSSIEPSTFQECYSLASIILPASVTSIGFEAFKYCKNLKTICSYNSTPPSPGNDCFYGVPVDATVYIPKGSLYQYSNRWKYFWDYREMNSITVSLNKENLTLKIGEVELLLPEVQNNEAEIISQVWTSSNPKVATVDEGTVTAVSVGLTTITYTVTEANGMSFSASCEVKVTEESGVTEITSTDSNDSQIYNLNGICVGNSTDNLPAGIYISGGKKIVITK